MTYDGERNRERLPQAAPDLQALDSLYATDERREGSYQFHRLSQGVK
jgi:hypothetical protein